MRGILKPTNSLQDVFKEEENDYQAADYLMDSDQKRISSKILNMPSLNLQLGPRNEANHAQTFNESRATYASGLELVPKKPVIGGGMRILHKSSQSRYTRCKINVNQQLRTHRNAIPAKPSFNIPGPIDPTLSSSKSTFTTLCVQGLVKNSGTPRPTKPPATSRETRAKPELDAA